MFKKYLWYSFSVSKHYTPWFQWALGHPNHGVLFILLFESTKSYLSKHYWLRLWNKIQMRWRIWHGSFSGNREKKKIVFQSHITLESTYIYWKSANLGLKKIFKEINFQKNLTFNRYFPRLQWIRSMKSEIWLEKFYLKPKSVDATLALSAKKNFVDSECKKKLSTKWDWS